MYRRVLLCLFLIGYFCPARVAAQRPLSAPAKAVSVSDNGGSRSYFGNPSEAPRAIEFKELTVTASQFIANIHQYLGVSGEFSFIETESNVDDLGMRHRALQQYYNGLPVEGMIYRVHEKRGFITAANGKAVRSVKAETQAVITEDQAFGLAVNYLHSKDTAKTNARKLIVSKGFTFTPESFVVAYQFDIDVSMTEQWRVSVDARNGQLVNKVSLVNTCSTETGSGIKFEPAQPPFWLPYGTGTGLTNYYGYKPIRVELFDGGSSRLIGQTEHGGIIGTYDFNNVSILSLTLFYEWHKAYEINSSNSTYSHPYHKPAVSAQWAMEQAFEYYYNKHNRNSFDNNGSIIKSYVHVDQNMNNAFWTHNLLAFGDGSNNNPLVDLDVVSHELTHGVTQFEAGLNYYDEPGALNESFSDILGKAVEFDTFGDTATWQMAKHYAEGGIRDLSDPNRKNHPDTYSGDFWYNGYEDYGGVHTNSGVQNFWFYLLCEGGTGVNDQQRSYAINAIGIDAATKIAYRNLTEYLGPLSDYLDCRIGSLLAAADLYGGNSVAYQEVDKAWDAVGVVDEPIITTVNIYDITATTCKIKGALLPRGDNVTYHFEYGTTPALGNTTSTYNYYTTVEGVLTGLQSETKYYLRLVATNENGSTNFDAQFTTISLAPLVKIRETVDVTETTAVLYGDINPNSLNTSYYFEYGTTPALGSVTPANSLPNDTEYLNVSATITDLLPRKTYYYRLVATNGFVPAVSGAVDFFTAVRPVINSFLPATATINTELTIEGANFNPAADQNVVSFGATRATVVSASPTSVKVLVPAGASFGPISLQDAESGLITESVSEFIPTFSSEFKRNHLQLVVGTNDQYIYQTLVQDMDGDGKPDIVARHYLGFSIFQNVHQSGQITEQSFNRNTFNLENSTGPVSLADMDGNGLKDIVAQYQDQLRIWPNFSVPGYIFFGTPVDLPGFGAIGDMVLGDFDTDGRTDIAGTLPSANQFVVIRNQNPAGSLSAQNFPQKYLKVLTYSITYLTTGDVNNDQAPDLIIGSFNQNFMSMLINKSRPGVFEFDEDVEQDLARTMYARYFASDLNGDGWKDMISHSTNATGSVLIYENKGTSPDVSLEAPSTILSGYEENALQPADINGDGKVDLLAGTEKREFILLTNKNAAGAPLSDASFEKFGSYGMKLVYSGTVTPQMSVNDLDGDGRPEIINAYSYNYGPHDGYQMEIWQNAPNDCLDPSLITVDVSQRPIRIVLPPNTTLDQFEIEYTPEGYTYWSPIYETSLYLYSGKYLLRARAKCQLGFTEYTYTDFAVDCVNLGDFGVSSVGVDYAILKPEYLGLFEVEYSPAGKEEWRSVYSNQILWLAPGTTYDLRFRGRCNISTGFQYMQFSTLCPGLSWVSVDDISYNRAKVYWSSNYSGQPILEYSTDNVTWTLIDETQTLFPLDAATQYFIRGSMRCEGSGSDFIYTSFMTPCPQVSRVFVDDVKPFSVVLNWTDETNAESYVITYYLAAGGESATVQSNSTSLTLDGLRPGTQYTAVVAPQCTGGKLFTAVNFNTLCYAPYGLVVNEVTETTAQLSWESDYSGMPYVIDYSVSGSNTWLKAESSATNAILTKLRPGAKYDVRVHITCASETASYVAYRFETRLYGETTFGPNPTDGKVTLHPSQDLIGNRFIITDNAGRIMMSGKLSDYTVDLTYFAAGLYTLRIDGESPIRIVKY